MTGAHHWEMARFLEPVGANYQGRSLGEWFFLELSSGLFVVKTFPHLPNQGASTPPAFCAPLLHLPVVDGPGSEVPGGSSDAPSIGLDS